MYVLSRDVFYHHVDCFSVKHAVVLLITIKWSPCCARGCHNPLCNNICKKVTLISDSRICKIVSKGPKYRFPCYINFDKCKEEIASALNDFGNRWCKREGVDNIALKEWKRSIFTIMERRIKFYS